MAKNLSALGAYRPRVLLRERVVDEDIARYVAGRTGFGQGLVRHSLEEIEKAMLFFALHGMPVYLSGLGAFTPGISLDGRFKLTYRPARRMVEQLNLPRAFRGTVSNPENIGASLDELIARWNAEHPEDPIG